MKALRGWKWVVSACAVGCALVVCGEDWKDPGQKTDNEFSRTREEFGDIIDFEGRLFRWKEVSFKDLKERGIKGGLSEKDNWVDSGRLVTALNRLQVCGSDRTNFWLLENVDWQPKFGPIPWPTGGGTHELGGRFPAARLLADKVDTVPNAIYEQLTSTQTTSEKQIKCLAYVLFKGYPADEESVLLSKLEAWKKRASESSEGDRRANIDILAREVGGLIEIRKQEMIELKKRQSAKE